jgi:uncharacterized protein DUF541
MLKKLASFIFVLGITLSTPSLFAQRTLSVTGSSTVMVKPDYATFTVHIDKPIPASEKWNAPGPDAFVDALVAAGISPQDVEVLERMPAPPETSAMFNTEMSGMFTPPPPPPAEEETPMKGKRKPKRVGEEAPVESIEPIPIPEPAMKTMRTTYRVKIQHLSLLPEAMSIAQQMSHALPDARYDVSDRNPLKMQALNEAMENARSKAVVLAQKMGGTLGEIISIDDSESGSFFSSILDIARMYSSGKLDGGLLNMPEIANVKVTYSVK